MSIIVRPFRLDEWQVFKTVRLKALQTDPSVFSATFEKEAAHPDDVWHHRLTNPDACSFGVFDADKIIGMTGVAVYKDDPSGETGVLWGSWLEPSYRGRGISSLMYEARIDWARKHPKIKRIQVSHRAGNEASKHANQKHGFVFSHYVEHLWHDGRSEQEPVYILEL